MPLHQKYSKPQHQPNSPYETPICKILVGNAVKPFFVNEGLLQRTSFFAKHGPPRRHNLAEAARQRLSTVENDGSNLFFPENESNAADDDDCDDDLIVVTDLNADYKLKGQFFYHRDAFHLFIHHLTDAELEIPLDEFSCQSLFQAYALAETYHVSSLQNAVIQKLQMYYREHIIPITDLIYVIKHWPANAENKLYLYLLAQVGFEMATDQVTYLSTNKEITQLFSSGNPIIIKQLFEAVLQHASPEKSADPSKDRRRWRNNST